MLAFFGFRVIILQLRRRDFLRDFLRDSAILLTLFFLREIRLVIRQTCMYTDIGVIDLLIGIRGIYRTDSDGICRASNYKPFWFDADEDVVDQRRPHNSWTS